MTNPRAAASGDRLDRAAQVLDRGGLVVYPTETLWGLGARLDRPDALRRLFQAKQRPLNQPISVAVADVADIERCAELTPLARRLCRLLPGPLTLVVHRRPNVPDLVTAGQDAVGIRVPRHEKARNLLRRTGPLTSTSANLHGQADPRTLEEARRSLGDRVNYYLEASSPPLGVASTVVDARGKRPRILRLGALGEPEIRRAALE